MTSIAPATVGDPISWLTFQARIAANEMTKGLRLMWRRRSMVVVGIVMNGLTYLGISLFIGGGHLVVELMVLTLPALLAMSLAGTAAIQGSGGIAERSTAGPWTRYSSALPRRSSRSSLASRPLASKGSRPRWCSGPCSCSAPVSATTSTQQPWYRPC
jgi:hypothetical protein